MRLFAISCRWEDLARADARCNSRRKLSGGTVIKAAVVAVCLVFMALPTARALDIPIVYLTRAADPRLPLAFVDPIVEDPGVWGARLALADNKTTGGFLGHNYEL